MSDSINVRATLVATNEMSPAIRRVIADIERLKAAAKSFSASFTTASRTGMASMDGFDRTIKAAAAQMQGLSNLSKSSARNYAADWDRANAQRLSDARRMHSELARLERRNVAIQIQNQRSIAQAYRSPGARSGGSMPRGISPTGAALAGGGLFAGVAAAFRARMIADAAETKAQIFGGLSKDQIKAFRSDIGEKLALKFGQSASTVVDTLTESLKAGFSNGVAEKLVNGILESAAGLELDTKALTTLAGKVATSIYGNASKADPARVLAMMNSVAVAAAETAADSNEIVEANKRALSILSVTKMNERDLSAFTGVGISAGLMPFKAGSLMDYLGNTIANAGSERGKRAEDMDAAAKMIGSGGRKAMAQKMIATPTQFLVDMFERMQNMSEEQRAKFANLVGKREWGGELLQLAKAADQIRDVLKNIQEKSDALGKYSATRLNSLQARWASIKTAFGIAFESFGEGFEETFIQVSDWFRANSSGFAFGKIREKSKQLVDGLKKGFGITSISDSLDNLVSRIQRTDATKAVDFVRGLAEGLGSVFDTTRSALKWLASIFGDGDSARGIGKFSAQLFGFLIALRFLSPVVSVLGSLGTGIVRLVSGLRSLGGMIAAGGIGSLLADSFKTLGKGIASGLVMKVGEILLDILFAAVDWVLGKMGISRNSKIDTDRLADRGLWQKLKDSFMSNEEFKKKYEKRSEPREVGKAVGEEIKKSSLLGKNPFAGNILPASFVSGSGGGFSYASLGSGRGIGLNGTPLHHAVPGQKLPSFGLGSNGIIRRENIPSFSGTGGSMADGLSRSAFERKFANTPLAGRYDQVIAAAKANNIPPELLAGIIAHETGNGVVLSGNNPGGIMDPATGWSKKMQFAGLDDGISKTAQTVAKNYRRAGGDLDKMGGFYAPRGAANDPNGLNGGWPAGVRKNMDQLSGSSTGSAGSGDAVGWAQKFKGLNEYSDHRVLAAALGGDVRGRSNAWCSRFVNRALAEAGGKGTGSAVANSFQRWGTAVDHSNVQRNDVLLQTNGKGFNQTGGHVGLATGETRMQNGRLQMKMIAGNDNDSVREHWIDADKNLMVRRGNNPLTGNVPAGVTGQVPPSSMIQNVPNVPPPSPGIGGGMMRGGFGPAQININGSSHDPESLATLVQRRIDESMNWRTHDGDSEYT